MTSVRFERKIYKAFDLCAKSGRPQERLAYMIWKDSWFPRRQAANNENAGAGILYTERLKQEDP